ncbi:scopoletin glucosyltransferase-like [Iris pallida]|uniref:Glycosyltransferase n=1 Tax=Iris pallida TaxID=29817 RepID=A0AAX6DZG3_IRIPA|nr:scopoletin glucosyltransferase-like [Iris pallida]KAJ6799346.1 scopoletin glucosyltransferase-like [Iris pallida]KAJ6819167.1 scopoletin glucosyltransferase-like [Iris pallida]
MSPNFLLSSYICGHELSIILLEHTSFLARKTCLVAMSSERHSGSLSMLFFPFMGQGHILPTLDMAKLFAVRGVKATILTTPANAPLVQPFIARANGSGYPMISLRLIPFPSGTGLPEGCENVSSIPSLDLFFKFFDVVPRLREQFDWVLRELLPDCVVTDAFFPWTYDAAAELGIPRLVFHGTSFFSLCLNDSVLRYRPLESLPADAEALVIPGLPHRIEMLRSQLPGVELEEFFAQFRVSDSKSYGVVVNSFYELEPDYARHYREVVGRRAWHIGPVALCNSDTNADESARGYEDAVGRDDCLKWLDSKSAGSVLYVCFGSVSDFTAAQLREMALGLEASSHPFVWVVRSDRWVPEGGFEERVRGRGLIIRGWAPQMLILNHASVRGFMTHCGWNSILEAVSAGLPLVTWPLFAEQFYNERLVVDVLGIGVSVGMKEYTAYPEERGLVEAETIKNAAEEVMGSGEEAQERRRRARELGETARRAVGKGGSSYKDMSNLIEELMEKKSAVQAQTPPTI